MFPRNRVFLPLALLLLSACGHLAEQPNPRLRLAHELHDQGTKAYRHGRHEEALNRFEQSLRAHAAIENAEGIAVSRLSLAQANLAAGRGGQAHGQLDALLTDTRLAYPAHLLADAAARKSLLYLHDGNLAGAEKWLDGAHNLCGGDCPAFGSLLNLEAQLALRGKRAGDALLKAGNAQARLAGRGQSEEEANAWRLAGDALLALGRPDEARARYEKALAIDRHEGLPHKIFLDLMQLSHAARQQGSRQDAEGYVRRALAVARALDDGMREAAARKHLETLGDAP